HELAQQRGNKVVEGHKMSDHVHMCVSIPPNYSVAQVIVIVKGKSTVSVAR
ncbi:MAG: transposase, partial [Deltaproteobacteria bacterium]|nr:transposase [Deltaproteobacteria bacterium]